MGNSKNINLIKRGKKKKTKCKIKAPHGRTSCTSVWGFCFYIYIYIYIDIDWLVLYILWIVKLSYIISPLRIGTFATICCTRYRSSWEFHKYEQEMGA